MKNKITHTKVTTTEEFNPSEDFIIAIVKYQDNNEFVIFTEDQIIVCSHSADFTSFEFNILPF